MVLVGVIRYGYALSCVWGALCRCQRERAPQTLQAAHRKAQVVQQANIGTTLPSAKKPATGGSRRAATPVPIDPSGLHRTRDSINTKSMRKGTA